MASSNPSPSLRQGDIVMAYTFLRVILGINFFNHGFTRIGNIPGFVDAMVGMFEETFIPTPLVQLNAVLVSPVELVFGLLLVLGLFTRLSLVTLLGLMFVLMYGVTLLQNWDAAGSQLVYDLLLCILLAGLRFNTFSLDGWWQRRQIETPERQRETVKPLSFLPGLARRRRNVTRLLRR